MTIQISTVCPHCGKAHDVIIGEETTWKNEFGYENGAAGIFVDYQCECGEWVEEEIIM